VFYAGKPYQALLNVTLTLLGVIPGMIHALVIVHRYEQAKQRTEHGAQAGDTDVVPLSGITPGRPEETHAARYGLKVALVVAAAASVALWLMAIIGAGIAAIWVAVTTGERGSPGKANEATIQRPLVESS
jgi:hypothetical protein